MSKRSLRGSVAIAGIGETPYYKHGQAPDSEFKLALTAILNAAKDAGIDPRDIDGFASYSNDRSDPSRIAAALGTKELRFSNMQWGGGGGGGAAAVGNAAAAVATGMADCVVVFRALAQGQFARFGQGPTTPTITGDLAMQAPYGLMSPGQRYAMKCMRFMKDHGVRQEALRAISLASYHHAQFNPRAVMHGRPLDAETYDNSRWIVEPWRLFDCCMENDGAAALIVMPADRAKDLPHKPSYLLGVAAGSDHRCAAPSHNAPNYASSSFASVAPHLYDMAEVKPGDVDVLQSYENFTGGVLMSLVEHGFFEPEASNDFLVPENLMAPGGKLPLNTSGGNLAECYMHGLELQLEAVRQLRGDSTRQVASVDVSMVIAGPMVTPVSSLILGSEATL
ncbi:MAG: acetyl-CoA acetyltransferase [Alphaproteobacteria bacterium]|jgi:acetyl-CoA acetyltransferase|nr:acetyl-CoA acetyltransferase [Alphaproteobacteria bacterium]